jgi:general secretion pathway protein K
MRRGSALISALMVLLVVIGLVAALAPGVRVSVRAAGQAADDQRALYLARGGVNLALAVLQQDKQQQPNVDGLDEDWATLGQQGQYAYPLGEGQFRLEVIDASSRLDLNQVDQTTLMNLPGMDQTTAEEILAWRSANSANNTTNGTSDDYESLPRPYRLKAAPFDSVDELLLVQGVTPLLLYGPQDGTVNQNQDPWVDLLSVDTTSPDTDQNGGRRINLNTASLQQIESLLPGPNGTPQQQAQKAQQAQAFIRGRPYRYLSRGLLALGPQAQRMVDRLTVATGTQLTGKVNINTAPEAVLETLPGMTQALADQIVQQRETSDITSLDKLNLTTRTSPTLVDYITTKTSTFRVRAMGQLPNGTVQAVEASVRLTGQTPQVTRWRVVPRVPGWYGWGWRNGAGDPMTSLGTAG